MTDLAQEIAQCRICADYLKLGPRPIVQFSARSRLVIVGQAPGSKVHESGIPWNDPSGQRLREWTGLDEADFYDSSQVALVPMGFCYPGKGASGDLPPRPECAPLWHDRILATLPQTRLTLLVGAYAQEQYLPAAKRLGMAERVRQFASFLPAYFPLPHPSWRSTSWITRNPWFERDVLPPLRAAIRAVLSAG